MADVDLDSYLKQYEAPKVDLDQYLAAHDAQTPDEMMKAATKAKTERDVATNDALVDTLLANHLPHVKAKIGQLLAGEGINNTADYIQRRDEEITKMKEQGEKYPYETMKGKAEGFLFPLLFSGGAAAAPEAAAAATPAATSLLKGAVTGGALAAAQNPGDTPGKVDPYQLEERGANGVLGAGIGTGVGLAANKLPALGEKLSEYAPGKAVKAAGAMLKDFRKLYGKEKVESTGRFLLDNGLVQAGDTVESIAAKTDALRKDIGAQLGTTYDAAKEAVSKLAPSAAEKVNAAGFNPVRDKAAILESVKKELGYAYKRKSAINAVSDYLDQLIEEHGNEVLNPKITNEIKSGLDKSAINWERNPLSREPDAEEALKALREALNGKVKGQIQAIGDATGNSEASKKLAELNSKYGMTSDISRIANDKANRLAANQMFGLTDTGAALGMAEVGDKIAGTPGRLVGYGVGLVGGKVAREYGPSVIAAGTNNAGKALSKVNVPLLKQAAVTNAIVAPTIDKGPDKWANDGLAKITSHLEASKDSNFIEQTRDFLATKAGKAFLIQASELKPGSKEMDNLLKQIKSRLPKGGE